MIGRCGHTTGLVLNGARYYDPWEGRWTQLDTLDAPLDPSNANRYAYAAGNPMNFTDPTGLARWFVSNQCVRSMGVFSFTTLLTAGALAAPITGGTSLLVAIGTVGLWGDPAARGLHMTSDAAGFGLAIASTT